MYRRENPKVPNVIHENVAKWKFLEFKKKYGRGMKEIHMKKIKMNRKRVKEKASPLKPGLKDCHR